jgi:nucleotide-binding universal stress UspA family protein
MFKKVLVALDGSRLAETALPYAAELAHAVSSEEVILLRVVEGGGSRELHRANKYLQDRATAMVKSMNGKEPLAGRAVRLVESIAVNAARGKAASSILEFAEHNSVDLIMTTHGRSGIGRWVLGSVAERVMRYSGRPVLMVRGGRSPVSLMSTK